MKLRSGKTYLTPRRMRLQKVERIQEECDDCLSSLFPLFAMTCQYDCPGSSNLCMSCCGRFLYAHRSCQRNQDYFNKY